MKLWTNDGSLLLDGSGNALLCDQCPCDEEPTFSPCGACADDDPPDLWEVTVAGIALAGCSTAACEHYNRTYLMERTTENPTQTCTGTTCCWITDVPRVDCSDGTPGSGKAADLYVFPSVGNKRNWNFTMWMTAAGEWVNYLLIEDDSEPCNEEKTLTLSINFGFLCSSVPTTVTITPA